LNDGDENDNSMSLEEYNDMKTHFAVLIMRDFELVAAHQTAKAIRG